MKSIALKLALFASACGIGAATFVPTLAAAKTIPIEKWAVRETIRNVLVSPNGEHMLMMNNPTKDGDPVLEIRKVNNLTAQPIRLNSKPMEIISASWINDDIIFGAARQQVRKRVSRPEEDSYSYKIFTYSISKGKFERIDGNFSLASLLPEEPDHILIQTGSSTGISTDPLANFRPLNYYRFNIKDNTRNLVLRGSRAIPQAQFDDRGNPVFATGVDQNSKEVINYYRKPGDKKWTEFARLGGEDLFNDPINFVGGKPGDPNVGYAISRRGENTASLWEFNFAEGKFGKKIYQNPEADVTGAAYESNQWKADRKLVAAIYPGAKYERHWLDMEEKKLYDTLEASIPNAHQLSVTSRSRDGKIMTVRNSGPKDPGSYYLINNGAMQKIGSENSFINSDDLANVEYFKFPARDGRMIPAYLTKPNTPGPWPLINLPHGGPYITEVIGYDEWGQVLANAGYAVLQVQYRGSTGHGHDHYISMWNEHGGAMQDDKDDGALYLVKQGKVDKDRMAMFGWSYGGYAALVAASRDPQIYQCTIAGAAVADPMKQYLGRKNDFFPYADELSAQRGGKSGINPMNEVSKVNIPILMVHGSVDRRVMPYHMKDYKKAMSKAGKDDMIQYLTLKGADHFYNTLMYEHQESFYTKMLDFLKNDCGPGGL